MSCDRTTGEWMFKVEHLTRYGLVDVEEGEEVAEAEEKVPPKKKASSKEVVSGQEGARASREEVARASREEVASRLDD